MALLSQTINVAQYLIRDTKVKFNCQYRRGRQNYPRVEIIRKSFCSILLLYAEAGYFSFSHHTF